MKRLLLLLALLWITVCSAPAQTPRLLSGTTYALESSGTTGNGRFAPFYLSSGRQGLLSEHANSAYARAALLRPTASDSLRRWRLGYGADIAVGTHHDATFWIQQLYADIDYGCWRLSVGSKERPMELKNAALSSGGLTYSGNARPVPQVRLALPQFTDIPGTHGWLAVKGHLAYGMMTDGNWQEEQTGPDGFHARNVLYHSKAGFLRIGRADRFPLTFTGGLEMYAQFGGEAWNVQARADDPTFDASHVKPGHGLSDFIHAFIPGGSDETDGGFSGKSGNQVGSWHFMLTWQRPTWAVKAYAEHFFEDESQMFLDYGWKDMLWGLEVNLPSNPIADAIVYEYLHTTDQSGGIYHDATPNYPEQISGRDNYYNHGIYVGWAHWGQAMGNPLLLSPVYNRDGTLTFHHNRVTAHHLAFSGSPARRWHYRVKMSHLRSLGTYAQPLPTPAYARSLMVEAGYDLPLSGERLWQFGLTFGHTDGTLMGENTGAMLTIRRTGRLF